jgi:CspA family cold shock protein
VQSGRIKWFNAAKGYGFIEPSDGGNDVFLHASDLRKANINPENLSEGAEIRYNAVPSSKGRKAVAIEMA